jgi:hypothetical protein
VPNSLRIFLSYVFNDESKNAADAFQEVAQKVGCTVVTGAPPSAHPPPDVVRSRIFSSDCFAAIMMSTGSSDKTSAWLSNEIGMAYALDMPLLIFKETAVADVGLASLATSYLSFDKNDLNTFKASLKTWLLQVRHDPKLRRNESLSGITNNFIQRSLEGRKTTGTHSAAILDQFSKTVEAMSTRIPQQSNWLRVRSNNDIVREVFARLNSFEALESKLTIATAKKAAMARAFVEVHGDDMGKFEEIFLESGSTIAELARLLANKLPTADWPTRSKPRVKTNNAFAYLYLWLCANVMCEPVPDGPPDTTYGGMYGALTKRMRAPDYKSPLSDYDKAGLEIVRSMAAKIFSIPKRDRTLILGAASGLQTSDRIDAIHPRRHPDGTEQASEPYTNSEILKQLKKNCRGFHVGGYENHLFKRSLYLTGAPTVVFIHDTKLNCPIEVSRCHFVSDADLPWSSFARDYPLSLWIACERRTYKGVQADLAAHLRSGGWVSYVYNEASDTPIVIAHNKRFRKSCEIAGVRPFSRL